MFSKFFIERPIFATVLALLIVVAGLVMLNKLPVAQYPDITPPTVQVNAVYPGANAETVAQTVGIPIEQQVNGVEGMMYMSSTSSASGMYALTVTFEVGTDIDMATVMVDGKTIGRTPLTEGVLVGTHKLSIVADGYDTYEKEIVVTKGGSEEINVALNVKKLTYKVGDYYDDGTKQGVVFYVDATGQHGKIVSLDQVKKQWCSDAQCDKCIVVGASSRTDGKANTDKVMSRSDSAEYSAFVWCRAKGKDWYLPAINELWVELLDRSVHDAVNRTLHEHGGSALYSSGKSALYWSSTEDGGFTALYVSMNFDYASHNRKYNYFYVRAVSAF